MRSLSITSLGWLWSAALGASVAFGIVTAEPARAASFDGAWVGEAALECDNFGDTRPPIRVRAEFQVGDGELSGTWTTPSGETYEVKGTVSRKGKIVDGTASSPTQFVTITGEFGKGDAKGTARGTFPGNLRCAGPWQAALAGASAASVDEAPPVEEQEQEPAPAPVKKAARQETPSEQPSKPRSLPGSVDGLWRGSANLECNNAGDSRPAMNAEIEMRVADGQLSGTWVTSTGDRYEIGGDISKRGTIGEAAARLEPALLGLTGDLKGQSGTGKGQAKGFVAGNLSCSGAWTVALVERVEEVPTLVAEAETPKPRVTAKADAPAAEAAKAAPQKKAKKAAEKKPVEVAKVEEQPEVEAEAEPEPKPKLSFSPGRYVALIIGNNDYDDMPDLRTAVNDAAAMASILEDRYGFETTVLKNASRKDVLSAMAKLRAALDYDSSLLIYYAGHGHVDEVTERGYWLPVDAARNDPTNWISTADITDMLKASPARAVLVIADSCYSGTLTRAAPARLPSAEKREAFIKRMTSKRARTVFASGGVEPVEDGGGGGHSVFAKALLDTLKENADVIDAQTLFSPVRHQVVLNADQTPEYSDVRLAGHEGGDFVFVPRE